MDESTARERLNRLNQAYATIDLGSPGVSGTTFTGDGFHAVVPLSVYEGIASELSQLRATANQFDLLSKRIAVAVSSGDAETIIRTAQDYVRLTTPPSPRED